MSHPEEVHSCFDCFVPPREMCGKLKGTVVIHSLFVSCPRSVWNRPRMARSTRALHAAARWIEKEARRFGEKARVRVSKKLMQARADAPVPSFEHGSRARAWLRRAMKPLGFPNLRHYASELKLEEPGDHWATIVHLRARGRSYALVASPGDNVEFVMSYEGGRDQLAGVHVHEILHLFGATDKYGPLKHHAFRRREIMNHGAFALSHSHIGDQTAVEIGWKVRGVYR